MRFISPSNTLPHPIHRGVAGGVVSQTYFEKHFGIIDSNGKVNKAMDVTLSSNVVSVLQAGAFFGALGSAPISGTPLNPSPALLLTS